MSAGLVALADWGNGIRGWLPLRRLPRTAGGGERGLGMREAAGSSSSYSSGLRMVSLSLRMRFFWELVMPAVFVFSAGTVGGDWPPMLCIGVGEGQAAVVVFLATDPSLGLCLAAGTLAFGTGVGGGVAGLNDGWSSTSEVNCSELLGIRWGTPHPRCPGRQLQLLSLPLLLAFLGLLPLPLLLPPQQALCC
jgi:hypothetical protein